jgi:hypothetical protein
MKLGKKIIALVALLAMLATSTSNVFADEYVADCGGVGYCETTRASSLAPAIALGTIALVAIIAVAVQNTSGHSHCHAHTSG